MNAQCIVGMIMITNKEHRCTINSEQNWVSAASLITLSNYCVGK